jgi:hypothetical protein
VITLPDLRYLDDAVRHALASGDESALHVLGYGEISSVVAWPDANGPHACKRLPRFDDREHFEDYRALFDEYVTALRGTGVVVHESHLATVDQPDGRLVAYCVQPVLPRGTLAPALLRSADEARRREVLTKVVDHIATTVRPTLGIDAQLSNWAAAGGGLVYLDVTTPLLRDGDGKDRLDTELFMASLPAVFRPVVRRFLLDSILDPYYSPRRAALDVTGNLRKEGLAAHVPTAVAVANERLAIDLTAEEVEAHYRRDARLWSILQRARRVDRTWQRHVRRRPYPFLLPGPVERGV